MTSQWARWRLKSPTSPLFTQPFIQAQIKENIKAPRHWPLCEEFTDKFSAQMPSNAEKRFHLMTPSCACASDQSLWYELCRVRSLFFHEEGFRLPLHVFVPPSTEMVFIFCTHFGDFLFLHAIAFLLSVDVYEWVLYQNLITACIDYYVINIRFISEMTPLTCHNGRNWSGIKPMEFADGFIPVAPFY